LSFIIGSTIVLVSFHVLTIKISKSFGAGEIPSDKESVFNNVLVFRPLCRAHRAI